MFLLAILINRTAEKAWPSIGVDLGRLKDRVPPFGLVEDNASWESPGLMGGLESPTIDRPWRRG